MLLCCCLLQLGDQMFELKSTRTSPMQMHIMKSKEISTVLELVKSLVSYVPPPVSLKVTGTMETWEVRRLFSNQPTVHHQPLYQSFEWIRRKLDSDTCQFQFFPSHRIIICGAKLTKWCITKRSHTIIYQWYGNSWMLHHCSFNVSYNYALHSVPWNVKCSSIDWF